MQSCVNALNAVVSASSGSIRYDDFRKICRLLPVIPCLTYSQVISSYYQLTDVFAGHNLFDVVLEKVEELIDNLDLDGTGCIFVEKVPISNLGFKDLTDRSPF